MANAKQCDICGAFYAAHKDSRRLRGCGYLDTAAIMFYDPSDNVAGFDNDEVKTTLETCPECMKNIKEFVTAMKENKNENCNT